MHRVVWVGRRAACPFLEAAQQYQRRLSRMAKVEVLCLRPSTAEDEARAMHKAVAACAFVVALDERGRQHTTLELAATLRARGERGGPIGYLIGGADGLAPSALALAHERWSLSAMTLPHRGVLAVWLEQLYRVHSIFAGSRYHRGEPGA
jgi:23S rRNA (pseudouridine1915-N3)-methyltransferase